MSSRRFALATASLAVMVLAGACVGEDPGSSAASSVEPGTDATTTDQAAEGTPSIAEAGTDAGGGNAAPAACDLTKDWGTPVLLAGVNGSDADEGPTLTADELTIIFATNRPPGAGADFDFWVAARSFRSLPFGAPTLLVPVTSAGINTGADERGVTITGDGLKLIFRSSQSGGSGSYDLFQATRSTKQNPFSTPVPISGLNTPGIEGDPFLSSDGSRLAFNSEVDAGTGFFEAFPDGPSWTSWTKKPLSGDLSVATDHTLFLTEDGLRAYFASNRTPSQGGDDIWTSIRPALDQPFGTPTNVAALNSASLDRPSWISADGCRFYLWSGRGGAFHIYVAERPH
jgi:hypothetical protein